MSGYSNPQQGGVSTPVPVANGGTGATDAAGARTNLGITSGFTPGKVILEKADGTWLPFATLTAAKTAASSGDLILVGPGTYDENNLLKNGVNWHFFPGAVVASTDAGWTVAVFDDGATGANGPVTCKITGSGVFTSVSEFTFHIRNAGSNITLEAESVDNGLFIEACSLVRVNVKKSTGSQPFLVTGGTVYANVDEIDGTGYVDVEGGTVYLTNKYMTGSQNDCLLRVVGASSYFHVTSQKIVGTGTNSGTPLVYASAGTLIVRADEIENSAGGVIGGGYGGTLRVIGARCKSTKDDAALGAAVIMGAGTTDLTLDGCTLVAHANATYAISASAPCNLKISGSLSSNKDASPDVTPLVGELTVDSNLV